VHKHLGGLPPTVDLARERALAELLQEAVGLVTSAHDLSDGGLAQALVESVLRHDVGVTVALDGDPFVALFSESAGRVVVTVPAGDVERLTELAGRHGVPVTELGSTGGDALVVEGQLDVDLPLLRDTWTRTLPDALG
jgi:phosphoribosylformylglycinamidine synthase subunit PurL